MSESEEDECPDCSDGTVLQNYIHVGQIVTNVITELIKRCVAGANVYELCEYGDNQIIARLGKTHKNKKEKGVGFPTCISVNHVAGHYSPMKMEGAYILQEGDIVKIDMGGHFDGFCVCMAHTVPIGEVEDKKADVIKAAWDACQASKRLLAPGKENKAVTEVFEKVADDFKVNVMEGVLSHETKQYVIDHENCIISKATAEHQVEDYEFESNKVMIIDVVMTTGNGKPSERDDRTTIYKRVVENNYDLKLKAARALLSSINKEYPCFPFTLRSLGQETMRKALLGVKGCLEHDLIQPYPVLHEKKGDFVAQFKYTALLLPTGTKFLEPPTLNLTLLKTDKTVVNEDVKKLLCIKLKKKRRRKRKKKAVVEEKQE